MRICLIASSRFPVAEPFAGGLEAMTHALARELVDRGHDVALFAGPGSDPSLPVELLDLPDFEPSEAAMGDVNAPSRHWMAEHHAYLSLMLALTAGDQHRFDVVHNNSLHHLPVAMARSLSVPLVTTLHTPPLPWLESAMALAPDASSFVAVSRATAQAWSHVVEATAVHNGVDVSSWRPGPGGGPAVWTGRVVPEKAPHEAIDACRLAGVPLVVAGPLSDRAYFEEQIAPRLGDGATYAGHLDHAALTRLLGQASVAVTTPAWDEPYGLVAAEAMACGTPVASYSRGALPEVVTPGAGVLARPGDVADLARAVLEARDCDRAAVRRHAEQECSLTRMVDEYERIYAGLLDRDLAA
ncbi:glycosyltransferase family 4 protein [Nocardioides sp. SOB77]|uniref:Glycosyltransferase family 4 protein n=1 Tax=Nocardioides oceani TaxID=3058369 RepID=A0ABT8FDP8_9ACTN|nr:glycosyltransferase family 4 protein [Nocardioides oceani]MDN4172580.1 glycosyltransferase family 4 protein [Nocardioides oceani]